MTDAAVTETVHGSCVDFDGAGVLLLGASGAGKSSVALELMQLGGQLVADDQVVLKCMEGGLEARCIENFEGLIEIRGIGIVRVPHVDASQITLVVDLDQTELQRLPPWRKIEILGVPIDLILGRENWSLCAGITALIKGGRVK